MIEKKINYIKEALWKSKYKKELDIDIIEDEYDSKNYKITFRIISEWYDEEEYINNTYELAKEFNKEYGDTTITIQTQTSPKETEDEIWLEAKLTIDLIRW